MLRKPLALTGFVLACLSAGLFIAAGIQVWFFRAEIDVQTARLAARAHAAGDAADHAITFVGDVIAKAQSDLRETREQAAPAAQTPVNPLVRMSARKASVNLAGSVERALGAMVAASDTVVVVDAALHVVGEYPELETLFGVNPQKVDDTRGKLGSVAGELRQAQSILGIPIGTDAPPTRAQLDEVDEALLMAEGFRQEMSGVVRVARERVDATKAFSDRWAWRLAFGTSAVCAVSLLGQFFMARFCLRKLRNLPA